MNFENITDDLSLEAKFNLVKEVLTDDERIQLDEIFEEEVPPDIKFLRYLAEQKYDFSGYDHVNCYSNENYRNGTLRALERTRKKLSIGTMESLIDFYFVLGYSYKRIAFLCFEAGYTNYTIKHIISYIRANNARLKLKQKQLMEELDAVAMGVFQQMKGSVMVAEKRTLEMYLENIAEIQAEMRIISPVLHTSKYNRLNKLLKELQKDVADMHGVDKLREATIEIGKEAKKLEKKRAIDAGWFDQALKQDADREVTKLTDNERDVSARVLEID